MKPRGKKMKGGYRKVGTGRRSIGDDAPIDPLNVVLIGLLLFIVYKLMDQPIHEKTIIREVVSHDHALMDNTRIDELDDDQPYRDNRYMPDMRQARRAPPFNIKTRGPPEEYGMMGFLQDSDDETKLQQLYGRRTYPNSNQWNYFVKSDQYHQIPIPVSIGGQNCTDERGCKELNDQESINILNKDHTATIYKPEPYYYNPNIF